MTELTPVDVPNSKEFGTIVNNVKPQKDEWQQKIQDVTTPLTVTLKLTANEQVRLDRLAEDNRTSRDEFIAGVIKETLAQRVGKATISAPSSVNGLSTKKVSAPSNGVWRTK